MIQTPLRTMTMGDFFRCTLPLISEHPQQEYTYSFGGTSFLVTYRGALCAITAQHVLDNVHADLQRLRVLSGPGGDEFLPLKGISTSNTLESHADIAIIEIDQMQLSQDTWNKLYPVNLDELNRTNRFIKDTSTLCLRGYPMCLSEIDYSRSVMKFCGYYTESRYKGFSTAKHCHELDFVDLSNVDSINGMSGSPVLHVIKTGSRSLLYDFAGMLIMGTKESCIEHFIDSSVIYAALDYLMFNQQIDGAAYRRP